jgi:DNA-binding response OmpR family regulator
MKKTVLVIDDDEKLNSLLKDYLKQYGYSVITAAHPDSGLKMIPEHTPDIIILDIMLPGMDGFEVCKEIRKTSDIPIIMLTARGEVTDRIVGLEIGADDYLPKPFEPRELLARMQSILRRAEGNKVSQKKDAQFGPLRINFDRQAAFLEDIDIELTTAEYEILSLFITKPGKVLSRDRILDAIRGIEWEAFNRSVDVLISRLRQKLRDDPKNPRFIKTIWGSGYMFIGEKNA